MDQTIIFKELLSGILNKAIEQGNKLSQADVKGYFGEAALTEEQIGMVCQYLADQGVNVEGYKAKIEKEGAGLKEAIAAAAGENTDEANAQTGETSEANAEEGEEKSESEKTALEAYLEEIGQLQELDAQEEFILFSAAVEGDANAREKLISAYLNTVCDMAAEFEDGSLPPEDLVQEGNMGLLMAFSKLEKQESLAAYQAKLLNDVNEYLSEALKESDDSKRSDDNIVHKVSRLSDTIKDLSEDLGNAVSMEEVSAFLDLPVEDIADIMKLAGDDLKLDEQ